MIATNVRFPDGLRLEAQAYAKKLGISFNALLSVALREYLDRRGIGVPVPPASAGGAPAVAATGPVASGGPAGAERLEPAPAPAVGHISKFFPGKPKLPCKCGSGLEYRHCHGR